MPGVCQLFAVVAMSSACVLHFAMSSSAFHIMSSCASHLHTCCRLHPVPRVSSRCPFRVPELPHVSVASRRPTLVFGRVTLPVWRETCRMLLCCGV